ncbi:MAG: ribonuclease III [Parasutterella sp.]
MLPLTVLEERIGYTFKNKELLRRAMTHRSFSAEHNERLEFLGDSVLNCVIGNALFLKDKHFDEGSLSRVRSNLVRQSALAEIAERIGISDFLKVGAGEKHTGGNHRPSTIADAVEAIFGAVFTDGGFEEAQTVIIRLYEPMLSQLTPTTLGKDAKTNLQEVLKGCTTDCLYDIVEIRGAPHDQNLKFESISPISNLTDGRGHRRQAEQDAAQKLWIAKPLEI